MKRLLLFTAFLAGACDTFPKDPDGTLDRVRTERRFRVGLIATGDRKIGADRRDAYLARLSRATGAAPLAKEGASEPLLLELEAGQLDLVVGVIAPESRWVDRVAIVRPLGETIEPQHLMLTPMARNGENRWIMLLEREARAIAAGPPA
ncbi:MAG TPA: hypothetical protein VHM92_08755 [Allosphingosinicella sp.]|nr:hypothetical protein [Allosphingosinicella sp.]